MKKENRLTFALVLFSFIFTFYTYAQEKISIERFKENPIISSQSSASIGNNINGPSLIKVPAWLKNSLGKYYLYFAHHNGKYIRLAYSDKLEGPWTIYESGTLQLSQTICSSHIASPDVHIDNEKNEIRMYYHGPVKGKEGQFSFIAHSKDGINFNAEKEILGESYFRVFNWNGKYFAMAKAGEVYSSLNGVNNFELLSNPFKIYETDKVHIRHVAVKLEADTLLVFYSRIGDAPERIMSSKIILSNDVQNWRPTEPMTILKPELEYEGVDLPIEPSNSGAAKKRMHELRDPAVYFEEGKTYLVYSIAGESGLAILELRK